jgi:hypothetical protein
VAYCTRWSRAKAEMLRQLDQLVVDTFFAPNEMSLQLDISAIGSKSFE